MGLIRAAEEMGAKLKEKLEATSRQLARHRLETSITAGTIDRGANEETSMEKGLL